MTVELYRRRNNESIRYGWHWLCIDEGERRAVINMTRPQLFVFGMRCLWTAVWGD